MASLNDSSSSGGNPLRRLVNILNPCQHKSRLRKDPDKDRETIIRVLPEVGPDGSLLPMVISEAGPDTDFSSVQPETLTLYAGSGHFYHGWGQASDRGYQDAIEMPFPRAYIVLEGRRKRNQLSDDIELKFSRLTKPNDKGSKALDRPAEVCVLQGVIVKFDGKVLEKPAVRQALVISKSMRKELLRVLLAAHGKGIDVFSPEGGYTISFDSTLYDGSGGRLDVPKAIVKLVDPFPIPEEQCRKLWVPWSKALVRHTYEHQVQQLVKCYGRDIAEEVLPEGEVDTYSPEVRSAEAREIAPGVTQTKGPAAQLAASSIPDVVEQPPAKPSKPTIELDLDNTPELDDSGDDGDTAPAATPRKPGPGPVDQDALARELARELGDDDDESPF